MKLIEIITRLVEERGISKNKMLTDLKLSRSSLIDWQARGTIPSGDTLTKIANYFDVSVDYLLGNIGKKEKPADLTSDELDKELIDLYNALPPHLQEQALRHLRFLVSEKESQNK